MSPPTRVTYFINSLEQGGAERQLAELIQGLDRSRFEPSLLVCSPVDQLGYTLPVATLRSLGDPLFPTPWGIARLASALRALRPDLVHTTKGLENVVGRVVARRVGVRAVVGSVRCPKLTWRERLGESLTHRDADALIVNSVGIRRELVALGVPEHTIDVVENGVDLTRFKPLDPDARRAARAPWAKDDETLLVLPGRLSPEKNQDALVRALGLLQSQGALPPRLRVVLAGRDSLLVYGRRVKAEARLRGLHGVVRFAGNVRDIEALLAAADAVLLPSWYEGLSNAVIESMACGVPVLVTPEANADGLVRDGVEGLVATSPRADDVARALSRLLALPPDARREMGALGRAHAAERFTLSRMVRRTEAVYERVLQRKKD